MPKRPSSLRPSPLDPPPQNKLLAGLPRADFDRLRPHLRTVRTRAKQVFHSIDEPIEDVVFLNGGVGSMTTVLQDGTMIETATVGREGFLGIEVVLGGHRSAGESMLQVPGTDAEFLPVADFRAELDRRGAFFESVQRYSQALLKLMMHSTACIAVHPVHERCCGAPGELRDSDRSVAPSATHFRLLAGRRTVVPPTVSAPRLALLLPVGMGDLRCA